ncbi:MAG: hypothetical protein AB8G22_05270 [Saprospiraceae bacterium]
MNFNKIAYLLIFVFFAASCANKNVSDAAQTSETAQSVANTFSADAVATAMCECMEKLVKETAEDKNTTMASLQKRCEKQGAVEFGNFKNDATKVADVNRMINENCSHLAAANTSPLQSQVQSAKGKTTTQKTKQQMADFKEGKTKKTEPKRKKSTGDKPKLEVEIE